MKTLELVGKILLYTTVVVIMTLGQVTLSVGAFTVIYPAHHLAAMCGGFATFVTVRAAAKAFFNEVLGHLFPELVKKA